MQNKFFLLFSVVQLWISLRANSTSLPAIQSHPCYKVIITISSRSIIITPDMLIQTTRPSLRAAIQRIDSSYVQCAKSVPLTKSTGRAISSLKCWSPSVRKRIVGIMHYRLYIICMSLGCARGAFLKIILRPWLNISPINYNIGVSICSRLLMPVS